MHKFNVIRNEIWEKFADDGYDVEEMIHCCANLLIATLAVQSYSHEEVMELLEQITREFPIAVDCLKEFIVTSEKADV